MARGDNADRSRHVRPPRPTRAKKEERSGPRRFLLKYGWLLPVIAILIGIGILALTYAFASIPLPKDVKVTQSAEVFDRHGHLIGTYSGEIKRFLIDTRKLPAYVKEAVISSEDKNYYKHGGVDLKGIIRAGWADITGGGIRQGGSTIAQQYVKNAILQDPSQTISRKIKEAILAIKLERRFTKNQILGFYLNTIYLGRGAYGIEAAARAYFNEHATQLSLRQAAFLAGIIPAPESYQPDENPTAAKARRDEVLNLMQEQGYISPKRATKASRGPVKLAPGSSGRVRHEKAAFFMEWLRKEYLYPKYGNCLYTCGLKIYTSLDLNMQREAEKAVSSTLTKKSDPEASLISMTPSGEVRAFVGGRNFNSVKKARGFDYASDPPGRFPGSSLKPFTLLTAIDQGVSPEKTTFSGASPVTITDPRCATKDPATGTYQPWQPENFEGEQFGRINLDQATTDSVNTVYAQLIAEIGPDKVARTLDKFGYGREGTTNERKITPNCSLALGAIPVTPLEHARAYAALASRGKLPTVTPIRYVVSGSGKCLDEYLGARKTCKNRHRDITRTIDTQNNIDVLTQVLTHVVQSGTATAANIGRPVAGKTGTTQDHEDAWFAGYVPQLTTVVWMGYPVEHAKGRPPFTPQMQYCGDVVLCRPVRGINVAGGTFPAVIWAKYMQAAVRNMPVEQFALPITLPTKVLNSPVAQPIPASPSHSPTPTPTPTRTASPTPSATPLPTPTPTPHPTPTPVPSGTPTS
ncbi:MAG: transglycosylase domain-containing protein [Actinomycetota bacterium]|nr:transglycosylase domain-containing protein [Actinomycetota bacterium]